MMKLAIQEGGDDYWKMRLMVKDNRERPIDIKIYRKEKKGEKENL